MGSDADGSEGMGLETEDDDLYSGELAKKQARINELEEESRNWKSKYLETNSKVYKLEKLLEPFENKEEYRKLKELREGMEFLRQKNLQLENEKESLKERHKELDSELQHYKKFAERAMTDCASSENERTEGERRMEEKRITTIAVEIGDEAFNDRSHGLPSSAQCSSDAEFRCWNVMFKITAVFALVTLIVIIFVHVPMFFI